MSSHSSLPSDGHDQQRGEAPSQRDGNSNRAEANALLSLAASPLVPAASTRAGSATVVEAASTSRTADTDQAGQLDGVDDDDDGSLFEDPFPNRMTRKLYFCSFIKTIHDVYVDSISPALIPATTN